jgi:hypothetical protein
MDFVIPNKCLVTYTCDATQCEVLCHHRCYVLNSCKVLEFDCLDDPMCEDHNQVVGRDPNPMALTRDLALPIIEIS